MITIVIFGIACGIEIVHAIGRTEPVSSMISVVTTLFQLNVSSSTVAQTPITDRAHHLLRCFSLYAYYLTLGVSIPANIRETIRTQAIGEELHIDPN